MGGWGGDKQNVKLHERKKNIKIAATDGESTSLESALGCESKSSPAEKPSGSSDSRFTDRDEEEAAKRRGFVTMVITPGRYSGSVVSDQKAGKVHFPFSKSSLTLIDRVLCKIQRSICFVFVCFLHVCSHSGSAEEAL